MTDPQVLPGPEGFDREAYKALEPVERSRLRRAWRALAGPRAVTTHGAPFPLPTWIPDVPTDIQLLAEWSERAVYPIFANTAARDAAIPSPTFGMMCQLQDSGTIQRHNGFVWVGDTFGSLTFINGWSNSTSSLLMSFDGTVELELFATKGSTSSMVPLVLPQAFRPKRAINAAGWCRVGSGYALPGRVEIGYDGTVTILPGGADTTITSAGASIVYQTDFLAVR